MTKTTRARYTLEFKQEAARLVEGGQSQASVARSLGVVIDLISRQVVGWSMREDMTRDIVIDALRLAQTSSRNAVRADLPQRPW